MVPDPLFLIITTSFTLYFLFTFWTFYFCSTIQFQTLVTIILVTSKASGIDNLTTRSWGPRESFLAVYMYLSLTHCWELHILITLFSIEGKILRAANPYSSGPNDLLHWKQEADDGLGQWCDSESLRQGSNLVWPGVETLSCEAACLLARSTCPIRDSWVICQAVGPKSGCSGCAIWLVRLFNVGFIARSCGIAARGWTIVCWGGGPGRRCRLNTQWRWSGGCLGDGRESLATSEFQLRVMWVTRLPSMLVVGIPFDASDNLPSGVHALSLLQESRWLLLP